MRWVPQVFRVLQHFTFPGIPREYLIVFAAFVGGGIQWLINRAYRSYQAREGEARMELSLNIDLSVRIIEKKNDAGFVLAGR